MYTPPEFVRHEFGSTKHIVRTRFDTGAIKTECHKSYGPKSIAAVAEIKGSTYCHECRKERAKRLKKKVYEIPKLTKVVSQFKKEKINTLMNWDIVRRQELNKWAAFTGQEPPNAPRTS